MNAGISRCWRYSRSITIPSARAFSMAASTSPPVPASAESNFQNADLLVPRSGCARTLSSAASLRSRAAGRSSYSTSTSSAASRAAAALRATTTATISPAKATLSLGIGRWVGATCSGVIGQALMLTPWLSPRSAPVQHVDDVGRGLRVGRVDAGDRGVGEGAAHHGEVEHPGEGDVVGPPGAAGDQPLVLLAAAVAADLRGRGAGVGGRGHAPTPSGCWSEVCPAACCTARTMLW